MIIKRYLDKSIWPSLLLLPFVNMVLFLILPSKVNVLVNSDITMLMKQVLNLLIVAVAEELFFRGLLLRELVSGYGAKPILAAGIVSLIFGALHIFNVFSYANNFYAMVQGICAFAVGFNLAAIYCKFKSLVPCIIIHALINLSSIGLDNGVEKLIITDVEMVVFLLVAALYLLFGYKMFQNEVFVDK